MQLKIIIAWSSSLPLMSITFQRSGYAVELRTSVWMPPPISCSQRGSYMVWEINMGVCLRLEFECLCNSIANLWRHEWYHYNTLGYPVKIITKVIDISCNGHRNILLNNYIIDKLVVTKNGFVCIRILDGHSFLWHGTSISTVCFVFSQILN